MKSFKRKHPAIFGAVVGVALASASAALAFIVFTGLSGQTSGGFTSATNTNSALVVSSAGTADQLDAGGSASMPIKIINQDNAPHTLTQNVQITVTSTPAECASHVTVGVEPPPLQSGTIYTANQEQDTSLNIFADASTPASCAGGTYTLNYAATTTP